MLIWLYSSALRFPDDCFATEKKISRNHCLVGWLIYVVAVGITPAAVGEPMPHPDGVTETSLRYRSGPYMLDTLRHQPYPFGSFAITVDKSGQGHLQSYIDPHRVAKMPGMKDSVILDWTERTSYLIDGKGRTQLSLESAKELWGGPRKHVVHDHPFYTFDAHSTSNGEENLYHLDLGFTKDGVIMGYRVRGIGIVNPQWVTDPAKTWVVEHVELNGDYE
jgi:hypothetical protein